MPAVPTPSRPAEVDRCDPRAPVGDHDLIENAEVIVIGLGAMGSAACCQLAARGVPVIGIDQFAPPHPWGSSHGDTRMTRLALGEGREYVPLVRRSHELWRQLEQETATRLLTQAGAVILGPPSSRFLRQTRAAAREYEIEHEDLAGGELGARFPMFALAEDTEGYYEPEAGYLRPEAAVAAQLALASRHGARLRLGEHVERWIASPHGVTVITKRETYHSAQLLLCPGAWIGELFPDGRELFAIYRQLLYWFPVRERYSQLRDMPAFVWDFGGEQQGLVHLDGFYGFPAVDGPGGGMKVASESYQRTTRPDGRQHPATGREAGEMYERCISPHLPWLGAEPLKTVSCLYTSTRGGRFVIDLHPGHSSVLIVSACSGHGFKHSPAIGEAAAQWLTGEQPTLDLGAFSLAEARSRARSGPA